MEIEIIMNRFLNFFPILVFPPPQNIGLACARARHRELALFTDINPPIYSDIAAAETLSRGPTKIARCPEAEDGIHVSFSVITLRFHV